jgi:hypothetical protein
VENFEQVACNWYFESTRCRSDGSMPQNGASLWIWWKKKLKFGVVFRRLNHQSGSSNHRGDTCIYMNRHEITNSNKKQAAGSVAAQ